jgi:hypothetical protein
MPSTPTPGDLHVSVPLTNISVAYQQDASRYIASQVFPNIPVQKQSDKYYKYDKGDWFRTDVQRRGPGAESVGLGWHISTDSYFADVWAVHADVSDQTRSNADATFNLDRDSTTLVTNHLLLRRDKQWITNFFTSGVWDTNIVGVGATPSAGQVLQWNLAGSTPIEDIYAQSMNMMEKTGYMPNTLVMGARVWQILANHPEIIDRVKYTQAGFLTEEIISRAFGVERILVAQATENTMIENKTSPFVGTFSFLAGKNVLLCYSNPNPGLMQPSAGYTFSWNGYLGASAFGTRMKKFRVETRASDRVEGEMAFSLKAVSTDLGCFYSGVVS